MTDWKLSQTRCRFRKMGQENGDVRYLRREATMNDILNYIIKY